MKNDLTTYQIYLMLLGYLTEHENTEKLKSMLTELYKKAEEEGSKTAEHCHNCPFHKEYFAIKKQETA